MTVWDRTGVGLTPESANLLLCAWGNVRSAEVFLSQGDAPAATRQAYRVMRNAAQALLWEEHGLRFRVRASYHAAFWDRYVRTGRVEPHLHRWLLEAHGRSARDGQDPTPDELDAAAAAETIERARAFLCGIHRCLGLPPPLPLVRGS